MAEPTESQVTTKTRSSYAAMVLSALLPGLGQLYLGQFLKGFIIFLLFASALGIFYLNSMPVKEWRDLTRFGPAAKEDISTDNAEDPQKHAHMPFISGRLTMGRS
jgi:hypothetical protein